jgi:16S rRNA (cytosine967-C5)-methyltransferase
MDWGFAATRLSSVLKEQRALGSHERRAIVETLFGMIRQARRLDYALEGAGRRLPAGSRRELARYLAYQLLGGERDLAATRAEMPELDWEHVARVDARIARERQASVRFGLSRSLPDWLATRLLSEYGDEADALAAALNERAPLCLRTNTLKTSREALLEQLRAEGIEASPTLFAPQGITLSQRIDVWSLAAYKEGCFEAQDEGSQLVSEMVAPPPHGVVVDACAGAGGKTLALGALMQSKGRIVATDIDAKKLEDLRKRARRAGISSVQVAAATATAWPALVGELFGHIDRLLIDAPCTGTGALRRNPEARWRLQEEDVAHFAAEQERLATRALELLAPGGRLVYITCSLLRAENEDVVAKVLARFPSCELVRAAEVLGNERAKPLTDATGTFLKPQPHRHGTDGFFAAVIRRR